MANRFVRRRDIERLKERRNTRISDSGINILALQATSPTAYHWICTPLIPNLKSRIQTL